MRLTDTLHCQHVVQRTCLCQTKMVPRGLEPRTLRLLAVRSNQLSYETSGAHEGSTIHTAQTARQSFQEGSYFFLLGQLPYLETTAQNNAEFTELPGKSYDLPTDFRLNPASRFFPHTRKRAPTLLGPAQLV